MQQPFVRTLAGAWLLAMLLPAVAAAQAPPPAAPAPQAPLAQPLAAQAAAPEVVATNACGSPMAMPAALPPAGSPPFFWTFELCFPTQGNAPNVEFL